MFVARPRLVLVLAGLAGAAALLAACGAAAARGGAAARRPHGTVVKLRSTAFGKVLVDARGRTLYLYTRDRRKRSSCAGGCAALWPPLLTRGAPRAGAGVKAKLLGVAKRPDGRRQVTYAGHPLYRYAADRKAGRTAGEGFGGVWYVVSVAGRKIEKAARSKKTPPTKTTTTTSSGYGNGY